MNSLLLFYIIGCIVAGVFLAWLYTKSGKKWLENL